MSRPVAVITGASAGIGAVFARQLAARGYDLLLVARRTDRLESLIRELPGAHSTFTADLATDAGIEAAVAHLAALPAVDLLVNNAGFGTKGRFIDTPFDDQVRMHKLHIDAILHLTRAVLPGMMKRDRGAIINVSSVAGYARSAGNVSYCATKSWINAFTEGIHLELVKSRSSVKVQALCPGFTYSEFHDVANIDRNTVPAWLWMKADSVVQNSLDALDQGKVFVVPGWPYKLIAAFLPKIPASWRMYLEGASPHRREV